MNLKQLRYFQAIAEHGSISRAAANLNVAQPAISRHIQQLEHELGTKLLQRHARGVSLTDAGEKLLSHASFLLRHLDQARNEILAAATDPVGPVSLAILPTVAEPLGAPVAHRMRIDYPKVDLVMREGFSGPCLDWLNAGTVDFAVLYNVDSLVGLETMPLMCEPICLVGAATLPKPVGGTFPVAGLRGLELILPSTHNGLRMLIDGACLQNRFRLEPTLTIDSLSASMHIVRRGLAYSVMPATAVLDDVAAGRMWSLPLVEPEVMRTLKLARIAERPLSTAAQQLRIAVREQVAHLAREGAWLSLAT